MAVVIPTLNEERCILRCLRGLSSQLPENGSIYVVDGGSSDRTIEYVRQFAELDRRVQLVRNDRGIQAAAVNLMAEKLKGEVRLLVRADAHAEYPDGFLKMLLCEFEARLPVSVVVPMTAVGTSCFQKAVAAAQNDRLGNGGSLHRTGGKSRFVDHGHHALFDLDFFLDVGGYDESFRCNEDAELDIRIHNAGGRIWMCAPAAINYFPRSTLSGLIRQYLNHGVGRGQNIAKHHLIPRARQLLPVAALIVNVAALATAVFYPAALIFPVMYVIGCSVWGVRLAYDLKDRCVLASGLASMIMHMCWAAGLIAGLSKALSFRRFTKISLTPSTTTPA